MTTVCIGTNTLRYTDGGGHQWVFLNWAMGFRSHGIDVFWLDEFDPKESVDEVQARVDALRRSLSPYGLADRLVLCARGGGRPAPPGLHGVVDLHAAAAETDLFLNASYRLHPTVVRAFRRSALLDIDPGLLQRWIARGEIDVAPYDLYFSIGETVGQPDALFPDAGVQWIYTPPCVALNCWEPHPPAPGAPFTTVSHWYQHEWVEDDKGEVYENNKRSGFVPYFDLPRHVSVPMELALCLGPGDEKEQAMLEGYGWKVRHAHDVSSTPSQYQNYIWNALGEFSGVKPSCVRLQNAWISDRTICFLASGKPAVVQHTGPSRFLPDDAGLLRFHDFQGAIRCLRAAVADYDRQSRYARALVEEYFDARVVTQRLLEQALA